MNTSIIKALSCDAQVITDIAMRSKAHWGYDKSFMSQALEELTYNATDIKNHTTFKEVLIYSYFSAWL